MEEKARKHVRDYVRQKTGEKEFLVYMLHGWNTIHYKYWAYQTSVHDEEILYKVTYDKCGCKYTLDEYKRCNSITLQGA